MSSLISLAKSAVENYIKEGRIISPSEDLPTEFLNKKAGVFVTIEKKGQLRGCIGTYLPTKDNIGQEIIQNAIAAAAEDYRFGPIQKDELPYLSYTVYILGELELVKDIQDPTKSSEEEFRRAGLNPKIFGIIVKTSPITSANKTDVVFNGHSAPKSGLLLPDLEGIDTAKKQISIACQKAGIDLATENILIYRFTAEKYGENKTKN